MSTTNRPVTRHTAAPTSASPASPGIPALAGSPGIALTSPRRWHASRASARAVLRRLLLRATVLLFLLLAITTDGYLGPESLTLTVNQAIGSSGFRLAAWEVQALAQKARDGLLRPGAGLTVAEERPEVLAYVAGIGRADELSREIEQIYADPAVADPAAAAQPLERELGDLREEQAGRRPAVERILERQTAEVLREAGLAAPVGLFPPVAFQFTESPLYLIVSPRDRIRVERGVHLDPSLPVSSMEAIESKVEEQADVSALVEGTGGFSSYPTMVLEYSDLEWVLSTIAHEWVHHYLFFRPLGQRYDQSGDMRTLNETVASIVGDEVARRLMLRDYPELVPPAPWPMPRSAQPGGFGGQPEERPFEFGPFMRETRLRVDTLLAEGKIAEAEAYMEARRQILVSQGYSIRKLNQAYFAFHGSYAVGPAATDPIGAKLRALRARLPDLRSFLQTVASFTSAADLEAALQATGKPGAEAAPPARGR